MKFRKQDIDNKNIDYVGRLLTRSRFFTIKVKKRPIHSLIKLEVTDGSLNTKDLYTFACIHKEDYYKLHSFLTNPYYTLFITNLKELIHSQYNSSF